MYYTGCFPDMRFQLIASAICVSEKQTGTYLSLSDNASCFFIINSQSNVRWGHVLWAVLVECAISVNVIKFGPQNIM
jgi:hypothetical protein